MARTIIALAMMVLAAASAHAAPLVHLRDIDPTIAQDMRYATADNFTGKPLPGYSAAECLLLPQVANALRRVQAELAPANLSLKVYDCYRPTRAVAAMAAWARGKGGPDTSRFYPTLDKSRLFALGYIAMHSAHSRGVAVDLTLIARNAPPAAFDPSAKYGPCTATQRAPDNSLDMGTGYDCFDGKSNTHNASVTPAQATNRRVLLDAMRKHGFANYQREWWHFSYRGADTGAAYDIPIKRR